jgi:KaiC/GvpD/RAD55 family RecA-like ATPase
MSNDKFDFDIDFQWQIIKYTLKDKSGYKLLRLYKHSYFEIDDQQIVAHAIERYFRRKQSIPKSASILNQEINQLFRTKNYAKSFLQPDRDRVKRKTKKLYKSVLKDADEIYEQCKLFASYIELKKTLEEVDLKDFSKYSGYSKKIQKAVNIGMELDDKRGSFIVSGAKTRILERHQQEETIPTPYRQINKLTNANGYTKGSIIVLVDKPKMGKTLSMVNFARDYMSRKGKYKSNKKVIYFDLENGETSINIRIDQGVLNKSKKDIISGKYDSLLIKQYRKYKRLGGEIYVIRMQNGSTVNDFQKELDDLYNEFGLKFEVAIIDYIGIMGTTTGKKDDNERISDAYLDVKNWAKQNDLDAVITGHHVKREGYKRRYTKYRTEDLAKCIDIERHVDTLYGIQQNPEEFSNNIIRLETMAQRDGLNGKALFHVNQSYQKIKEFTKEEIEAYDEFYKDYSEDEGTSPKRKPSEDLD